MDLRRYPALPENTSDERLAALARHAVATNNQIEYFTILTQKVWAGNILNFADCLIHYEQFQKLYDYEAYSVIAPDLHSPVMYNRLELWFKEHRKSNDAEEEKWAKAEQEIRDYLYVAFGYDKLDKKLLKKLKALVV